MRLRINGQLEYFVPIKQFRADFDLPETFGVGMFEPKDYTGLGRIDQAGGEMKLIKQAILEAVPSELPLDGWLSYIPHLSALMRSKLHEINPEIGLKTDEIEFAVAGFQDVCQHLVYTIIRARADDQPVPKFEKMYEDWLSQTVRISSPAHSYIHRGDVWAVQIVNTVYGRSGIIVWTDDVTYYVQDISQACPAEGFMQSLLHEVAARLISADDSTQASSAQA